MLKKILLTVLAIIVLAVVGVYIYVQSSWDKTYDWPGPALKTTTDSVDPCPGPWSIARRIVYRTKYLVFILS